MNNPIAVLCIIGSCVSLQLGAAFAVQLFPAAGSWGTASLRLIIASLILLIATRPKVHRWSAQQWRAVVLFGASMGAMNGSFYTGLSHIPLGSAVTIEFIGPLLLAAVLSRSARDIVSVILAFVGLGLLGLHSLAHEPLNTEGVVWILIAAFFWACYILTSKHAGRLVPGQGGLAVAIGIGGLGLLPLGTQGALAILKDSDLLLLAVATAVLASLVPYSLELVALRRIEANMFSILISLEPVFAAFFGWLLLSEALGPLKLAAIALVISASILQTMRRSEDASPRERRYRISLRRRQTSKVG